MARIYRVAVERKLIAADRQLSDLAEKLDESPQTVKNWDRRGPSAAGLVKIQERFGINAAWARSGDGAAMVSSPQKPVAAPTPPSPAPGFAGDHKVTDSEWALLQDLRAFPEEDRGRVIADIHTQGERWRAIRDELIAKVAEDSGRSK